MDQQMNNATPKAKTRSIFTGLILALGILFILNLLSSFFFTRLDFSKGRVHTLSKTSKTLVRKLDDNVVVKAYMSPNLPPDYNILARYTKDLLGEYKLFGRSRFRFELVPQSNEDEFRGEATRNNIFTQRVMILENDQQTVRDIFMGLTFEYKGNRETLNLTKDMEGRLEYEITSIIRRLTKANLPQVSVYQDTLYTSQIHQSFEHHMNQNYRIIPVDLIQPVKMSDVLVVPGVVDSLSKIQLYNLDQYIMHGGKVIFLQDRAVGLIQYNEAQEINSNLFDLLKHYGIEIKKNIVMDENCAPITMKQRSGIFVVDVPVPFPPIPLIQGNKDSEVSKGLSDIIFYLASEINTKPANKDVTITPLLQTSPASGIMQGPVYDLSPQKYIGEKLMSTLNLPPLTVAALATGKFTSYFAKDKSALETKGFVPSTTQSQIMIISDADLIREFVAGLSSSNMMFVLNVVDFMLGDTSLVEVRSRSLPNSPLEVGLWLYKKGVRPDRIPVIEPTVKRVVKGINIILSSLLLILFGVLRFFRLKRHRLAIKRSFEAKAPLSAYSYNPFTPAQNPLPKPDATDEKSISSSSQTAPDEEENS